MTTAIGSIPPAESVVAAMIFGVVLVDDAGLIRDANPAAEAVLKQGRKRLLGTKLADVMALLDTRMSKLLGDDHVVARETPVQIGGKHRLVSLSVSPLASPNGWRVLTISEAAHDHRENRQGEAPNILAHEIKNPLAAIKGAGQLLARQLPNAQQKLADVVVQEADRIANLVNRMQHLGSKQQTELGPCNPHEAVRAALSSVKSGQAGSIQFVESFDPSLPPALANDAVLEQALINLLSNACEALNNSDAPKIIVSTRFVNGQTLKVVSEGRTTSLPIEIVVRDNGPGVPAESVERLFEPFFTTKRSGQGLGLALVRKLVTDMGGLVSYERDDAACETAFRINLPLAKDREA